MEILESKQIYSDRIIAVFRAFHKNSSPEIMPPLLFALFPIYETFEFLGMIFNIK